MTVITSLLLLRSRTRAFPHIPSSTPTQFPLLHAEFLVINSHHIIFHSPLSCLIQMRALTNTGPLSMPDAGLGSFHIATHLISLTSWYNRYHCFHFKIKETRIIKVKWLLKVSGKAEVQNLEFCKALQEEETFHSPVLSASKSVYGLCLIGLCNLSF